MKKHSEWFKGLQACELMIKDGKVSVQDHAVRNGCVKANDYLFVSLRTVENMSTSLLKVGATVLTIMKIC